MKRAFSLLLMVLIMAVIASYSRESGDSAGAKKISYQPGTYSATVVSMKGDLTVEVGVDYSAIQSAVRRSPLWLFSGPQNWLWLSRESMSIF